VFDDYDFGNLKNEAERLVLEELERQLEAYPIDICKCNDCVVDMAAMGLNAVKPLYRSSLLGGIYTAEAMRDDSYAKSIKHAVKIAIEKISLNPGHT
jgi:competence protein ComFB